MLLDVKCFKVLSGISETVKIESSDTVANLLKRAKVPNYTRMVYLSGSIIKENEFGNTIEEISQRNLEGTLGAHQFLAWI